MAIQINENWKRLIALAIGAILSFLGINFSPLCPDCDCPENQAAPQQEIEVKSDTLGFGGYYQGDSVLSDKITTVLPSGNEGK